MVVCKRQIRNPTTSHISASTTPIPSLLLGLLQWLPSWSRCFCPGLLWGFGIIAGSVVPCWDVGQIKTPCSETCRGILPHSAWEPKLSLYLTRLSLTYLSLAPQPWLPLIRQLPHAGLFDSQTPRPYPLEGLWPLCPLLTVLVPLSRRLPPFLPSGLSSNVTCSRETFQATLSNSSGSLFPANTSYPHSILDVSPS